MRSIRILGSNRFVYEWNRSLEPCLPTEEDRARLRQLADGYDEAEHERIRRLAFPAPPPEHD